MVVTSYYGALRGMVDYVSGYVKDRLTRDALERLVAATAGVHHDAPPAHRVNRVIRQAQDAFDRRFPLKRISKIAEGIAKRTASHHKGEIAKQIRAAGPKAAGLTVSLDAIAEQGLKKRIRQFTAENVALIQDVPRTFLRQVESLTLEGIRSGQRSEDLADDIAERTGVAKSRALLIARDQVGKFVGDLAKARQTDLGVKRFIWRTSEDERVRESHAELDGEEFAWDDPPEVDGEISTPGSPICCRCDAEPVIESAFEDDEDDDAE